MTNADAAALWRRASAPASAHDLALQLLGARRYAHSRGVAQQSARLAALTRQPPSVRRQLLSAAWLHDIGYGLRPGAPHQLSGARALRASGNERLARIVAHHSGAAMEMALRGFPPVVREFPRPDGLCADVLMLLDIADLTTSPDGERATPAARLRSLTSRRGIDDPAVRVLVATASRIADDPDARALVERISATVGVPAR